MRALGVQQIAEDAIDGERVWRLRDGYDALPHFLRERVEAAGGQIVLGAQVAAVEWIADGVRLRLADARLFEAVQCVVTVPLGVLHAGGIELPPEASHLLEAARRMRMGDVCRFTLIFRRPLWPEAMSFLLARALMPGVWWTARPADPHTLTGWSGGPRSQDLLKLTDEELRELAVRAAARALNISEAEVRDELVAFRTHNWRSDPRSQGAYSWVPAGALDASRAMCEPVNGTLFVAGEHTDVTGHWGTVHAALGSGLRAARQLLEVRTAAR